MNSKILHLHTFCRSTTCIISRHSRQLINIHIATDPCPVVELAPRIYIAAVLRDLAITQFNCCLYTNIIFDPVLLQTTCHVYALIRVSHSVLKMLQIVFYTLLLE